MESESQNSLASDLEGTVVRPPSIRVSGSFKSTLSGRLTPRSSPSFKRSPSVSRTSIRDSRPVTPIPWYRKVPSRRLLPWLVVIGLWGYIALLVQSRWAHNDGGGGATFAGSQMKRERELRRVTTEQKKVNRDTARDDLSVGVFWGNSTSGSNSRTLRKRTEIGLSEETHTQAVDSVLQGQNRGDVLLTDSSQKENLNRSSWIFPSVGTVNDSVGVLVGPFDEIDRRLLAPIVPSFCESDGIFARFVRGKTFMLVLHELSMTGSPLAMMELGSEILSCGGKVIVVPLSKKGGLLQELNARGIKVLKNKAAVAYRTAAKVDLLVAGSAVCASWIDEYLLLNKKGSKRLVWWIMENRREYFDRSKHLLGMAKVLIFLSYSQLKQWQAWSHLEGILLPDIIRIIPLSVNGELSVRAGLYDPEERVEETKKGLRDLVRSQMGLKPNDVLLTTLSSINPGKGQLKLLQAVAMVVEEVEENIFEGLLNGGSEHNLRLLKGAGKLQTENSYQNFEGGSLRVLIGSVGSKSNKVDYVQKLLDFISNHPRLARLMIWTPVTVHVASLYAASDAYVMNSQGLGETFGRVTVEAMAFALPVLGTDSGGTSEIVENNVTGILHPVGTEGVSVLAQHIIGILRNATFRQEMGLRGRDKVKSMYLKETMYENLAKIFIACLEGGLTKRSL